MLLALAGLHNSSVSAAQARDAEPTFLLLEVRLEQAVLSSAIPAYDMEEHTLLPLGELSRLLTIAIQTNPRDGTAGGFVLSQDRGFSLSLSEARVTRSGATESFDPELLLVEPDDLYVAQTLLERWLPVALEIDRASMSLRVHALEALPLQERLQRERLAERATTRGGDHDPGFRRHELPYRFMSLPFIDQNITTELRRDGATTRSDTRYSAFLTGDALGMESSVFVTSRSGDQEESSTDVRATLARHDPDADLLGPLHARSVRLGSLTAPSVENVARGVAGEGLTLSNRPLTQPTSFDRQTFEGDLPAGWDVELYYNDALVNFQLARADGQYRFEDQPLSYGRNDFRLVFHGPLGQTRVEQHSFSLAQSMVRPGEFQYSLTGLHGDEGQSRAVAQVDLGIARHLSASAGFVSATAADAEQQFTSVGLRTFRDSLSVSGQFIAAKDGGSLSELGFQTRVAGVAVDASRLYLDDFDSDIFKADGDPIRTRDDVRLSGAIPVGARSRLPVTLEARRQERASGLASTDVNARVSAYVYNTAFTNNLRWHASGDDGRASGSLQISRWMRNMSLRGKVDYRLGAERDVSAVALSADQALSEGYRLRLSVARTFATQQMRYTAGFTKSLGRYGLGLNASYLSTGEVALGARLVVAMGHEPQRSDWLLDAQPMANDGAASVLMFLDDNNNGVMDPGEEPLQGAGFTVDGRRHRARTDGTGIAHIEHLPIRRQVAIGVDNATLEDPQWAPQVQGLTLVPRPGRVAELQFPVRMTSEIDGTVSLYEDGAVHGVGDLALELLNKRHEVVAEATSGWDGFYIVSEVPPGDYWLRVAPAQLKRLSLIGTGMRAVSVPEDGSYVNGIDLPVVDPLRTAVPAHDRQVPVNRPAPAKASSSRAESWLRTQPPGHFGIQLVAAGSEATVQAYIERHRLQRRAAYVRTTYQGAPWYVVIYGSFARYHEALAARRQLPPALSEASPWLRRYGEIQDAATAAR